MTEDGKSESAVDQDHGAAQTGRGLLRVRTVLVLLIAVAVLPPLLVQVGSYYYSIRELRDQDLRSSQELSRLLALSVEGYVRDLAQHEQSLGAAIPLKEPYGPEGLNALLQANAKGYPALRAFIWVGLEGKILASSDLRLIGVDVADREYFQQASKTHEMVLSGLLHGRLENEPLCIVAKGIYDKDDKLEGILAASVDPDRLGEVTMGVGRGREGHLCVFDQHGMLAYRYPQKPMDWEQRAHPETGDVLTQALAGHEAVGVVRLAGESEEQVVVRVPVANIGWVAGTGRPKSAVVRTTYSHIRTAAILNLGVLAFSLALAVLISRLMAGHVRRLHRQALALGQGRTEVPPAVGVIVEFQDLAASLNDAARKRLEAEEALRETAGELARSNRDLEQFAYVASHDLQEPLRTITGHLQLVERRLGDNLDPTAGESMRFVIDGASRMQAMIRDLLAYSRAGRRKEGFQPTDMEQVLAEAAGNLHASIEEVGAKITHGPLATVAAERTQMVQLLQNLLSNAVKYRTPGREPEIDVGSRREEGQWVFWLKDNGIGIAPEYQERVFMIFQRLHALNEYPGTGIGLAICKRIVEYHGGRIWVESASKQGATFFFTVPDRE